MKYIRKTKSKRLETGKHVLCMRENKRTRRNLIRKTEGRRKLGQPKREQENNNNNKNRLF
jgi:hypothetical protein